MKEYHKIDSVFKRDERGNFLLGQYSRPEFEYLAHQPWNWTEKIDGTNIRVIWDAVGKNVRFGGKTDNAQIPVKLITWLQGNLMPETFMAACLEGPLTLYGEGYGAGIQSGGNYSPEQKFILFDVKVGDFWLERGNVEDIASKLNIDVVRQYSPTTLHNMIDFVMEGLIVDSAFDLPNKQPEGYVGTPTVPLFNRKGERIITKIKYKDFR